MSSLPKQRFTPEQYLESERKADYKSDYYYGEIFAMAGASPQHNIITANVIGELRFQLKGRSCQAFVSDMRVRVSEARLYTYPDVVAVCGELQFDSLDKNTLTNPTLVIEVLSPSTEAYDRGEKAIHYRRSASLQEYILIAQEKPLIEHYTRQPNNQWLLEEFDKLPESMLLSSIDCGLPLSEIYDKVEFTPLTLT